MSSKGQGKRNILFLIADDLGKYIGAYDCPSVRTPHLDALAAEGVRFDHAFASTASCSGSRSTIYTGLHTHENGQYGLNMYRTHFQTFPHVESAPLLFNRAGYHTGILGKIHVGLDETYPWEYRNESDSRDVAWVADQADEFFGAAKKDGRPWYLTIGFVDPHRDITTRGGFGNQTTYDARIKPLDIKAEDVEVPSWLTDLPEVRQELAEYYQAIYRLDQGVGMILEALKRQGLDDSTMVIFTSDNGPPFINAKTTLYDAGTCLPLIIRSPLSLQRGIVNPNMVSYIDFLPTLLDYAGIQSVTSDLPQQSLSTGGPLQTKIASPPRIGRSFLGILDRTDVLPEGEWQHHIFGSHTFHELTNYWPTRVLRTRKYKYHRNIAHRLDFPFAADLYASYTYEGIRNSDDPVIGSRRLQDYLFRPAEELFDVENDPDELHNLAKDPAHQDTLRALRLKLEQWQVQTRDGWLYRDGQSLRALDRYAKEGMHVPDRFDVEPGNLGTKHVSMLQAGIDIPIRPLQ